MTDNKRYAKLNDYDKNKITIIKNLINSIGFNLNHLGKDNSLENSFVKDKLKDIMKNNKIFEKNNSLALYGVQNKKIGSTKSFVFFVNSIIKKYGFEICFYQKSNREGKKVRKNNYIYLDKIN